jgi:hypothetical protein
MLTNVQVLQGKIGQPYRQDGVDIALIARRIPLGCSVCLYGTSQACTL